MQRILLAMILLVVLFFVVSYIHQKIVFTTKSAEEQAGLKSAGPAVALGTLVEIDTDHDGLADWEEPLWNMDPTKADTDGNGVSDGEQVAAIRASIDAKNGSGTTAPAENQSQTVAFSQQLFSTIAALQTNGTLTDQTTASIVGEITDFIKNKPPGTIYYTKDIKSISDTSTSRSTYATSMNSAFAKYPIKAEDFALMETAVTTPDTTSVNTGLAKVADKYKALKDALLKISVPQGEADIHLRVVNSVTATSEMFRDLSNYAIDPIPALAAVYQGKDIIDALSLNMGALNEEITGNSIY